MTEPRDGRPVEPWSLRRRLLLAFLLLAVVAGSGGVASAIALRDMTAAYHASHAEFSAHEALHEDQIRILALALALRDRPTEARGRLGATLTDLEREGAACTACHEPEALRPGVVLRARLRAMVDDPARWTGASADPAIEPVLRELASLRGRQEHDVHEVLEAREDRARAILGSLWLRQLGLVSAGLLLALAFTPWLARTLARSTIPLIAARGGGATTPKHDPDLAPVAVALDELAGRISAAAESEARRQLLDRVLSAQEEERQRVARELHDDVGQRLLALLVELRQCAGVPEGERRALEARVTDLSTSVYRMAKDLRPALLDDLGLALALPALAEEVARRGAFAVAVEVVGLGDPGARLPSAIETVLYRITQEALSNVARHAGARRADVVLTRREDAVTLFVEDDGRGFDVEAARVRPSSLGLLGMAERAGLVGGALTITSTPGQGTVVRVQVPLGGSPT